MYAVLAATAALITSLVAIPYAQTSANAHMNPGPLFGFVYALLSLGPALYAASRPRQRCMWLLPAGVCAVAGVLCWSIGCQGCAMGG